MWDVVVKIVTEFVDYVYSSYLYANHDRKDITTQVVNQHNDAYLNYWLHWKESERRKLTIYLIIVTGVLILISLFTKSKK